MTWFSRTFNSLPGRSAQLIKTQKLLHTEAQGVPEALDDTALVTPMQIHENPMKSNEKSTKLRWNPMNIVETRMKINETPMELNEHRRNSNENQRNSDGTQ